jgi:hypothetical protein
MRNLKLLTLGLGLSFLALTSGRSAADPSCEVQCQQQYQQCQQICSKNPCFVSCDTPLQSCLSACDTSSQ